MNQKHKKKLITLLAILFLISIAAGLILFALKQNINLFYTPTELLAENKLPLKTIRVGGYVKDKSIQFDKSGEKVMFIVTDRTHDITIQYQGILPNLFREGQTVVVTGKLLENHTFIANQVLAKHDEKYIPKSVNKEVKNYGT
jgi:cytochrome c-type biogenesis protein CcmE